MHKCLKCKIPIHTTCSDPISDSDDDENKRLCRACDPKYCVAPQKLISNIAKSAEDSDKGVASQSNTGIALIVKTIELYVAYSMYYITEIFNVFCKEQHAQYSCFFSARNSVSHKS